MADNDETTEQRWQPIETAPDDFQRPGGQRTMRLLNRDGRETLGRRGYFNNSGWVEASTNRELWPTHWMPKPDPAVLES